MAKVLGESGRYVTKQAIKKFQKQIIILFLVFYSLAIGVGYLFGVKKQPFASILLAIFVVAIPIVLKFLNRITEKLEAEKINFRKGAVGEAVVGYVIENFPADYRVIHDLTKPFGNIDHVVIGPSGVYIIDTKNWKGIITADGNGEILLNGKQQKQRLKIFKEQSWMPKKKLKSFVAKSLISKAF